MCFKRKCDLCSSKVEKQTSTVVRLTGQKQMLSQTFDFNVDVKQNEAVMNMGEPILVNPNSYESVTTILDSFTTNRPEEKMNSPWM